jgi:hypothetical protein
MKTALIAFVTLGIAAGFGPSARADSEVSTINGIITITMK